MTPRYQAKIRGCCDTRFGVQQEPVSPFSPCDLSFPLQWGVQIGLPMSPVDVVGKIAMVSKDRGEPVEENGKWHP